MIRKMFVVTMLVLITVSTAMTFEIANISLPDSLMAGKTKLTIIGAGLRKVFGFKVYAGGLYLEKRMNNGIAVINSDSPMAIRLQWRRSAPSDKIKEVYYKSFAKVVGTPEAKVYGPKNDYGPLTGKINKYMSWISNKKVEKGFYWNNIYIPGKGTDVYVYDGTKEIHAGTIEGLEFKKILFSIWLGHESSRSVSARLKNQMLGKDAAGSNAADKDKKKEVKDVSLDELDNI